MEIGATSGILATGAAIVRGQQRFDDRAAAVSAAALSLGSDESEAEGTDGDDLTQGLVGMQADAISNQVLFSVFKKQQEQQQDLMDLISNKG